MRLLALALISLLTLGGAKVSYAADDVQPLFESHRSVQDQAHQNDPIKNVTTSTSFVADNFSETDFPIPRVGTLYILSELIMSVGLTRNLRYAMMSLISLRS